MQAADGLSKPMCSSAPMPQAMYHKVCRGCQHLFSLDSGMQAAGGLSQHMCSSAPAPQAIYLTQDMSHLRPDTEPAELIKQAGYRWTCSASTIKSAVICAGSGRSFTAYVFKRTYAPGDGPRGLQGSSPISPVTPARGHAQVSSCSMLPPPPPLLLLLLLPRTLITTFCLVILPVCDVNHRA